MTSTERRQNEPRPEPPAPRVVFLVDESASMNARVVEATRSRAETTANAVNALLARLHEGPALDVAIVGYRGDAAGAADVACRWSGPLAGRRWVASADLAAAPLAVEQRVRKVAAPGGGGEVREQSIAFPVWYRPSLGGAALRQTALEFCLDLLRDGAHGGAAGHPALIFSIVGDHQESGDTVGATAVASAIREQGVLIHVHLSCAGRVPTVYFPSQDGRLPPGPARTLFAEAGVLPDAWRSALCEAHAATASVASTWPTAIQPGGRGLVYHGRAVDLIRLFGLVHAYRAAPPRPVETSPSPAVPVTVPPPVATTVAPRVGLLFVIDRGSQTPGDSTADAPISRLFQRANELLAAAGRKQGQALQAAMLSYGAGPGGACEVASQFTGPLAGRVWVGPAELAAGPIRVDEAAEQVPNGIGGLMTIQRRRPIYFDLSPTRPADPEEAFRAAGALIEQWRHTCAAPDAVAIVVHCTSGNGDPAALGRAAGHLRAASAESDAAEHPAGRTLLYHLVQTEAAHRSVAYAVDAAALETPALRALCATASPLLGRGAIAPRRPSVSDRSRGMVVNGQFDAFWDGIELWLAGDSPNAGGAP